MADFAVSDIYGEIDRQAKAFGIDPLWAKSLLTAENTGSGSTTSRKSYSGDAVSSADARGVLQVIPSTARGLQGAGLLPPTWKHDPNDLGSQVAAGLAAMKDMQTRNKSGSLSELAAMYNGGVYNQQQFQSGKPLSPETTAYIPKVLRAYKELGGSMGPQEIERAASGTPSPQMAASGKPAGSMSSQTTASRVTSQGYDPEMFAAFNQAAGILGNTLAFAKDAVANDSAARQTIGAELVQLVGAAGESAAEAARAKATVEATSAARRGAIIARAGLDADSQENRATRALDIVDQTSAALAAMRPDIDQRMATGFFDNPIAYLINQTILPGQVAQYNQVVKQQQDALGTYRAAKEIAASQISLNEGIDADKILAAGAANAKAAADEAIAKQKQIQLQLSGKASADALTMVQLASAGSQAAREALQLTRVSTTESESQTEAQKQKARDETTLSNFNVIAKAAGGTGYQMEWFKTLTPAARTAIQQATSRGTFGKDFGEAVAFVDEIGDVNKMARDGQLGTAQWLLKAQREASLKVTQEETAHKAGPNRSKAFDRRKSVQEQLNALGSSYQDQSEVDMVQATEANPWKIAYNEWKKEPTLAANSYVVAMNKWGPGGTEPIYNDFNEQQMLKRISLDIQASKDPQTAIKQYAQDISKFYQTTTAKQALQTHWPMFGLNKPSKIYAAVLPQLTNTNKTVDLGDPAQVENMLTKKYTRDVISQQLIAPPVLQGLVMGN